MAPLALCAFVLFPGLPKLGKPVAEHTYYLDMEKALAYDTPDLDATSNHWSQATDQFYVCLDSRKMTRDSNGKVHLPEFDLEFKSGGVPYKQEGRAPKGLGPEFHWVINPSPEGTTKMTYPAYDVSPGREVIEYIVKTTIVETEVRLVNNRRVTRTQTTDAYGTRFVGFGSDETYDPVTERRFKR